MNKTSAWGKTTSQCCETRGPVPGRLSNFASGISGWGRDAVVKLRKMPPDPLWEVR